ncbi:cobyric acid synthase CobQ [Chloroherpeton thalassium ATCC 35110]|uniref:Cobyric acid synthase n=1 Tax=Chloroherpeton thalassium (strain ATCC 35110 / GB-78) TaxID=517418 RepID=B3QZ46_CHLT3|nr:cobyric acid synthase [Chloroherpeton thalassium]ACF13739.1 cobyric acid synthase CobQ [Chloroherpeton thalassium ATCC 35110]
MSKIQPLKPMMVVGTASDAGKSLLVAGLCRIFKQDGFSPAPFKAQNMSLNSYATPEGFEIGRAQATQAEAAGIACHTDMNPVLLKPTGETGSQIVLNGKPIGTRSAYEYYNADDRHELFREVCLAFDRLRARYNPIVMEGAGSISELNIKQRDITNMRMALHAGAATYLVSDIERGGVFGSVYGTIALLPEEERKLMKGIIINKFRGDSRLFHEGRKILEDLTQVPVVGVLPYIRDLQIDEEDSVALQKRHTSHQPGKINIAVLKLSRIANYTDFRALEHDPRVRLYYTLDADELEKAQIILIPGSKNTIEDLAELKSRSLDVAIRKLHRKGTTVIGICGGYQIMGTRLSDPYAVECKLGELSGLGLLPMETELQPEKTTLQRAFHFRDHSEICYGYEIHMGKTEPINASALPVARFENGETDGCYLSETCWGTYLHGILDNPIVIDAVLRPHLSVLDETPTAAPKMSLREQNNAEYDKLAAMMREHLDMAYIYSTLKPA